MEQVVVRAPNGVCDRCGCQWLVGGEFGIRQEGERCNDEVIDGQPCPGIVRVQ